MIVDSHCAPKPAAAENSPRSIISTRNLHVKGRQLQNYDKLYIAMQYHERKKATGISQNQFSREIGISQRNLARYLDTYQEHDMMALHSRKLDGQGIQDVLDTIKASDVVLFGSIQTEF